MPGARALGQKLESLNNGSLALTSAHSLTLFQDHIPFAQIPSCFMCVRSSYALVTLLQLSSRPRGHYYCSQVRRSHLTWKQNELQNHDSNSTRTL